jgi:phage N-6-adenine-methyltransferase
LKSIKHLSIIKIQDNYETPDDLYYDLCNKFKIFPTLDVCATKENSKCINCITEEEDSLLFQWNETFFMNPPYSKVAKFMKKAYYQHLKNKVEGMILIFAKTDTQFWHSYIEEKAEVHFIKGRIKFLKDGYRTKNSAPYPSCIVIYRLQRTKELKAKLSAKLL